MGKQRKVQYDRLRFNTGQHRRITITALILGMLPAIIAIVLIAAVVALGSFGL